MRSKGIIKNPATKVFNLLTSPQGFAILDPVCDTEDHKKPLIHTYEWKDGARLEVALARVNFPIMPEAEFIVLNAIDPGRLIFMSKSVVYQNHPGSSPYFNGNADYTKNTKLRALNTMALYVKPIDQNTCELLILNYIDMCIQKGKASWIYNLINKNFFHKIYKKT